jgi:hypothetical protein
MGTSGFRSRVDALDRSLPSYGVDEYVFPSDKSNIRFAGKRPYLWDIRKPFQAARERAGITNP